MQRLARCASVAALLLAALAGAAAQPSGYAGPATANPSRTSPAANAAPATTRTTTTVNPLFLPRAWSPFKDYKEGEVAVGADGRNYAAKYWNRNTTVTPTPGASQDDIDGWAWKPATEADVQKHIQWWSSWYSSITATPFTKTEADVSTPMIETPQPTPLKNRNKGYGMVPAAGTRVNKGWMCMEWIDDMGYTFPVRIIGAEPGSDSGGNPACLATNYNKTSCNYVSTWFGALGSTPWSVQFGNFERCQQLVDSLNETSPYIMCGSEHNKTFGWPGYDETDPNSWCSAAALALDIRPDLERTHTNSGPMNTTFENAAGRVGCRSPAASSVPSFPSRPAPELPHQGGPPQPPPRGRAHGRVHHLGLRLPVVRRDPLRVHGRPQEVVRVPAPHPAQLPRRRRQGPGDGVVLAARRGRVPAQEVHADHRADGHAGARSRDGEAGVQDGRERGPHHRGVGRAGGDDHGRVADGLGDSDHDDDAVAGAREDHGVGRCQLGGGDLVVGCCGFGNRHPGHRHPDQAFLRWSGRRRRRSRCGCGAGRRCRHVRGCSLGYFGSSSRRVLRAVM
ncbi:hypothetical protein DFJ74DRAFT_697713 [Hyaloraphidium curvatum]|nr:hypothetical protein DFJ74DRAFT_697713 [Hyaloraphidium curvatum]